MRCVSTMVVAGLALGLGSAASAQVLHSYYDPSLPAVDGGQVQRNATGDTYGTAVVGFSGAGGAFLHEAALRIHTLPATDASMGAIGTGRTLRHSSSVTVNGSVETYVFEWTTSDGAAIFGSAATIGGQPITTLSFELGRGNATTDTVDHLPPTSFIFDHPEDTLNPGFFLADFELLNAAGADLLGGTGSFFVRANGSGTGFDGLVQIGAGGSNLGNFGIVTGRATISVIVPAPASAALLAAAGVFGLRRRR